MNMNRKRKEDNSPDDTPHYLIFQKKGRFYLRRPRLPKHARALTLLEAKFGSQDFSAFTAARAGVDGLMLKELVSLGSLRFLDGRYDLNRRPHEFQLDYDCPIFHDRLDSKVIERSSLPAPIREPESLAFQLARDDAHKNLNRPQPEARPDHWEPLNIFKQFRLSYRVYLLLRSRFRNLSAYIRFLIYTDLGMTKEAEHEKMKMGPLV